MVQDNQQVAVKIIRVGKDSVPTEVAGALAGMIRDGKRELEVRVIGAGALNNGVKGVIIARQFLVEDALDIAMYPTFGLLTLGDGEERTYINLRLVVSELPA